MRACVSVDEIARELVASMGKATPVSLTCCCKTFEGPVLCYGLYSND